MNEKEITIGELENYLAKYDNVDVNTDTGFKPIKQYNEKGVKQCYKLIFEDNFTLECSYDHFIMDAGDNWWSPENLIAEDDMFLQLMFQTDKGYKKLLEIVDIGEKEIVDLEVDDDNHRYYTNGILSHNSGKTLLALSGAMKMIRKKQYSKIVYIRNSIESTDKGEEIGFLSGNEEKFAIYNHPLMDSIEYIVRNEMKKTVNNKSSGKDSDINQNTVQEKIEETIDRYAIETMWTGEARGRTISDAIVIIDEAQNMSNNTMQLMLTRIDCTCKVMILGSNKQIDNFYINKHTNGLSTVLNSTQMEYEGISLFSVQLNKVLRGPITEWAENIFTGEFSK
jgi:predicted ribonuclease YlaK